MRLQVVAQSTSAIGVFLIAPPKDLSVHSRMHDGLSLLIALVSYLYESAFPRFPFAIYLAPQAWERAETSHT